MGRYRGIEDYWRSLPPPPAEATQEQAAAYGGSCSYAPAFADVAEALLAPVRGVPGEVSVNIAMLQLQAKFFDFWRDVPQEHKVLTGHRCVFQVYEEAYRELRELELRIVPPKFSTPAIPAGPPPKPEPRFFLLPEDEDDE